MSSSKITDYIGVGLASARPTSPSVASGAFAFYWATDTSALYIWNGSAWQTANSASSSGSLLAVQRFNTHQTVTPTFNASTNSIVIKLLGAGGGGRSVSAPAASTVSIGAPGGGGAYLEKLISGRSNFVGKQLIVGTAGVGGAASGAPNNGTGGTATSFDAAGANYSAGGGEGGTTTDSALYGWIVNHAHSATASNGDLNVAAPPSLDFSINNSSPSAQATGGAPAAPHYGAPGTATAVLSTAAVQGGDATGNGAGGSGGISFNGNTPLRGGNGTDGYVEIWEYS